MYVANACSPAARERSRNSTIRPAASAAAPGSPVRIAPSRIPSFEEAQPEIRGLLQQRYREVARRELVERLRGRAYIEYFPAGEALLGR